MKLKKSTCLKILALVVLSIGAYFAITMIKKEKWEGPNSVMEFGGRYENEQTNDFFVSFVRSGPMSFSSGYQMLNLYDKNNSLKESIKTHPWFVTSVHWENSMPTIFLICAHKECGCEESKKELVKIESINGYKPKWSFTDH